MTSSTITVPANIRDGRITANAELSVRIGAGLALALTDIDLKIEVRAMGHHDWCEFCIIKVVIAELGQWGSFECIMRQLSVYAAVAQIVRQIRFEYPGRVDNVRVAMARVGAALNPENANAQPHR